MSKHLKPRVQRHVNSIPSDELLRLATGRWLAILTDAGMPSDTLADNRRGRACPRCGGVDRFNLLPDFAERGAVLCRYCFNGATDPRCGDGVATLRWWLGVDVSVALRWLTDWLGLGPDSYWVGPVVCPIERRLAIPEQSADPERFRLMADLCRRNMRPAWLCRAAELLRLPIDALDRLGVGWSPVHRATSWPMRDDRGSVIGVRLRCPSTAKKWAVKGSRAGLFYSTELLEVDRPKRLMICEGPTDAAALLSIGLYVVGVPSAGGGRDLLVSLCRRIVPAEVVVVADSDGPGLAGAERLAEAVMIVARVRIVSPVGCKDARSWVCAGADRAVIESAADAARVRSIVMEAREQ